MPVYSSAALRLSNSCLIDSLAVACLERTTDSIASGVARGVVCAKRWQMSHRDLLPVLDKCTTHLRAIIENEDAPASAETEFTRKGSSSSDSAKRLINIWRYTGEIIYHVL